MKKTVVKVNGMMCKMCEEHLKKAISENFSVKKITASHSLGVAEIISENPLDKDKLSAVIKDAGYAFISATEEEKTGVFGNLFGKKNK